MGRDQRTVVACLGGVAVALLVIGIVSATLVRHVIQIVPVLVALLIAARRPAWGALAAIPILAVWSLLMILIWLYLLGVSRIVTGHFTVAEIVLTGIIAALAIPGIAASIRLITAPTWSHRARVAIVFVAFAILQIAAIQVSYSRLPGDPRSAASPAPALSVG